MPRSRITMPVKSFPTATVTGRVVDGAGKPLAGATIAVQTLRFDGGRCTNTAQLEVQTAHDGSFALATLRADLEVLVRPTATRSAISCCAPAPRPTRSGSTRAYRGGGACLRPTAALFTGSTVSMTRINHDPVLVPMTAGAFDLARAMPGDYTVAIEVADHPLLGTRTEYYDIKLGVGEQRVADLHYSSGLDIAGIAKDPKSCVIAAPADYNRNGVSNARACGQARRDRALRHPPPAARLVGDLELQQVPEGDRRRRSHRRRVP